MSKASEMTAIYAAWWRRLPANERVSLIETGFDPKNPGNSGIGFAHRYVDSDRSASSWERTPWSARSYDVDYALGAKWQAEMAVGDETLMDDRTYTQQEVLDIIRKVIAPWTDSQSPDVRLFGTCQYIALGVPGQPTMTELAKRHNVTRAEISRRVKHIQRKMGLPPSVYMKSDHACERLKRK